MKINSIAPDSNIFLQILSSIAGMPESLYYMGDLPKDRYPAVAIVGSRKPTTYGKEVTYSLSYELAKKGVVIVSGLALGIDGIAHQAALDAGGKTVAVLGNGLPNIHPRTNEGLARKIIESGGLIVSEYKPGMPASKGSFLKRNRIVSGLSDAILVTEAASRSGTLNTAAHALEQGKEIFAVPGNITSPLSAGCNALIRQGATPVTSVDDILSVISPSNQNSQTTLPLGNSPQETTVIGLISKGIQDGDELQKQSGLVASDFAITMTSLELDGVIKPLGANRWMITGGG
jgi:DNA processing protein